MEEICRVCRANSGPFTNIFDETHTWDTCIADMISQCTGYAVSRGDLLPENICPPCLEDAVNAFNLIKTCEQSHTLFLTLMEDDREEDNLEGGDWEPSDIENEQSNQLETDEEIHQSLTKNSELNEHTCIHTVELPHKCTHCSKSFARSDSLRIHIRSHTGERPYQCPHCYKSFSKEEPLHIHICTHTGERPYKCSHCSQSFQQKSHLREHTRIHTGERPFRCSYCSKSFKQKSKLDRHNLTHTGERPYQCTQCSKSFQEKSNLQVHLRSHKCIHCSKTFRYRNSSYQRHILTHTSNDNCAIPSLFEITAVRTLREDDTIAPTAEQDL
ncbi:zinc finger protein 436-like [Drosophila persimilis]|uniref:zinc finger protein 436-like n=1 Tax=Drosophila persimilis TaxID=7234 RepID=UPI000F097C89|nr:zinc finger protein 436-like [Drosophila persimilis]